MEQPAARLEVVSGKGAGMSVLITDELLIGRNAEGAGRLAEDDEISRTHARVTVDGTGRCVIEDLGSTNGTFVNGQRISAAQQLAVGDKLELGATMLLVQDLPAPPVSPTIEREVPPEAGQSPSSGTQGSAAQPSGIKVEPTVINAPIVTPPPASQEAAEPAAPRVEPTAVPPPAEPAAPRVEPTAAPPPAEPDLPQPAPIPVAPPMLVQLEVDFAAGEVRITPGDLETVRFVFRDGKWRPATA